MVSIHVQSVDQLKAIKLIKGKITDLDRMKIEEQKKAVRSGYDMEIIPSDLATYGGEAKKILDDLQSRNERMFLVTVLFLNTAKTKQELDSAVFQTAGIAQKFNCTLNRLDYLQEQGLMSSLPLGNNLVPIKRALTTTSTAIFVPFTTQELFMEGDSLYYGLNAVSNNMIMADRKQLKNPNGLILGTPGSGKSFSAKREITNVFFTTTDDIIVADPEGEYYPLVEALGGQVIHISSTSKDYINPMDINLNYADDDNPLGMKSDFILSLCELIMGARDGMEPEEKSVIDRCLPLVYQKYLNDPKPENMPTLGDLYDCLREQKERQAQRIATALEIYVNGSLRVFNHQTNVELDNRIICFDIKELGKQLKKLGIYDKYGQAVLDRTLRLAAATWEGENNSFSGNILMGIARIVVAYGDTVRDDVFKDHVGRVSVKAIIRAAKERRPGALGYSEAMIIEYNKKSKFRLSLKTLYGGKAMSGEDDFGEE